jgi:hypothetical protein
MIALCAMGSLHAEDELQQGAFFSVAPVYWKADGQGLALGIESSSPQNLRRSQVKNLHFEWDFGFEVGLGYRIPHDLWSFSLNLKHLHTTAESSAHAKEGGALFPLWTFPSSSGSQFAEKAHGHWRLHLGLLDFLMEKQLRCSRFLSLFPQVGLRSSWIRQKYNLEYSGGNFSGEETVRMKNKFWGIGPAIGMRSDWTMVRHVSLFADLLASINYGQFYLHQDEDQTETKLKVLGLHGIYKQSIWMADITAGIRWSQFYSGTLKHVSVEIAWDQIFLYGQNQHMQFVSSQEKGMMVSNQGDLALIGFHVKAQFDF